MNRPFSLAAAAVLCGLMISGCTTGSGMARLENPSDIPANGGGVAFPGVLTDPAKASRPEVRYIFHTHGMGMTDANSVLIDPIAFALQEAGYARETNLAETPWIEAPTSRRYEFKGEALWCEGGAALQKPCRDDDFGQYRIDRFLHADGKRRVVVYSYLWHEDLWSLQKPFLAHDLDGLESGFAGWTSGSLSGVLKTSIVNEGLSDVAAYLGPAGKPLRDGMSSAVCIMLREAAGRPVTTDDHNSSISLSPSKCLGEADDEALKRRNARISFISHSLGSRMLFDVIGAGDSNTMAPSEGLKALSGATDTFFMAANQLALLGIARGVTPVEAQVQELSKDAKMMQDYIRQDCPGNAPGFLTVGCRAQSVAVSEVAAMTGVIELSIQKDCPAELLAPEMVRCQETSAAAARAKIRAALPEGRTLWVVGFFDPGDVLGYSLMGGRTGPAPTDIRFISVLHRNTPQILGLGSNPLAAHDNELALETLPAPGVGQSRPHQAPPYNRERPTRVFKSPNATAMILCGAKSDPAGRLTPDVCPPR